MAPRKAAYIATVYGHLAAFHLPFMEDLKNGGCEVHAYAAPDPFRKDVAEAGFEVRDLPFSRRPLSPGNIKALLALTAWLKKERYDIVHVHTPNAALITRTAAWIAGCRGIYYTAHGFHFYRGAPIYNWLVYYPLERLAARVTDVLITINREDYARAATFPTRGKVVLLPGVGVADLQQQVMEHEQDDGGERAAVLPSGFANCEGRAPMASGVGGASRQPQADRIRGSLARAGAGAAGGLPAAPPAEDAKGYAVEAALASGSSQRPFVILCMAELNRNKNQEQLLRALQVLRREGVPAVCLLAGTGPLGASLQELARQLGIAEAVHFLGYRRDGAHLMAAASVVALLSRREGLPKLLLEALSVGRPIVATDVRGSRDLVTPGDNGFLVAPGDVAGTAAALRRLYQKPELAAHMGRRSREMAAPYRLETVRGLLHELYT